MAHILCSTDFSAAAAAAYAHAARLCRTESDRVTLCHVVVDLKTAPQGAALAPPQSSPALGEEIAEAEAKLQAIADHLDGAPVTCKVLTGESVATALTEYAEESAADYIVIATHGRTGIRHLVLGSVTEEVVRRSRTPVISVPAG